MCFPALLAALPGAAGAGTAAAGLSSMQWLTLGLKGLGTLATAAGQAQAGKNQAKIAEYNAQVKDTQARDAAKRGQEAVSRQLLKAGQLEGRQRAAIAASGVELSGSPLAIVSDSRMLAELDAKTIAQNYQRESLGYSQEASGFRYQGSAAKKKGKRDAFGTLLEGGGDLLSAYDRYSS